MKIFLISLRQDTARRTLLSSRFPGKFKEFEVVNAIDGSSIRALDYFELTAPLYRAEGHLLSPGEVGCALSHVEAYRRFLSTDEKMALFIEDDIEGCDEDISRIMRVAEKLNGDFLLCCGAQDGLRSRKWLIGKPHQSNDAGVFIVNGYCYGQMWRTACYVLSRGMAASLLEKQTKRLCKADDWAALLKYCEGEVLFLNALSHPIGHGGSRIETERVLLTAQHLGNRRKSISAGVSHFVKKLTLYWTIFISIFSLLWGHRRIFKDV